MISNDINSMLINNCKRIYMWYFDITHVKIFIQRAAYNIYFIHHIKKKFISDEHPLNKKCRQLKNPMCKMYYYNLFTIIVWKF